MRIAQVAPLYESVPPKLYGGTERVVAYLTEALVAMGHEVTLFASGDSVTSAHLRPMCDRALRLDPACVDSLADHVSMAERVLQESEGFDVVHAHIDYLGYPFWRRMRTPRVTTLHGRLDIPNLRSIYREFSDEPIISISQSQRQPLPQANWKANVLHGLPADMYVPVEKPAGYLAFIGRVSPEKRLDLAIQIANRARLPLKIAAKVDKADREYYDTVIKPLLKDGDIEFIGEIDQSEKNEFLGRALALVFPIDWPEPFGLVMIEAMACGTPVIATRRGSVPEVVEHGISGFIVNNADEAVEAIQQVERLDRRRVREQFDLRFTAPRMARDYVAVYEQLIHSEIQTAQ
jgi:glycosyltransferase involved in cell wall biosynthesis